MKYRRKKSHFIIQTVQDLSDYLLSPQTLSHSETAEFNMPSMMVCAQRGSSALFSLMCQGG